MRNWYNVELAKDSAGKFKEFLRDYHIKFESSECGNLIHFEVFCNRLEMETANKFLDGLDVTNEVSTK